MTKPRRRTQAERSEEMRARLAQAAYEVIAERGHSAFRTAALVAHAGVSQGALLHHFPNKEAVTLAAIDHALELANDASNARLEQATADAPTVLRLMAEDFHDFFLGDKFWVALDITMDAAKDAAVAPKIRERVSLARGPVYAAWVDRLVRCNWDAPRALDAVRSTAALISGYGLRTLWVDGDDELTPALDQWFRFLLQPPA